jgi:ribosomal-protein-serine acetyltransferase
LWRVALFQCRLIILKFSQGLPITKPREMRTELRNQRIRIRRYLAEDVPLLFEAARESIDETFTRWMPWCHPDYTIAESSAFVLSREEAWQKGEEYDFAIFDLESGAFLGGVALNQFNRDHGLANLGYWIRRSAMGRGIAPIAALLTARFGFEDLGLHRVEIVMAVENERSQRVAEKTGAQREGVLRNRLSIADRRHDAVMYSLVAADLAA